MTAPQINTETARSNMIMRQIRPWNVLDPGVLKLLEAVRREDFVPPAYQRLAFSDMEIPIGDLPGQVMLSPVIEARMLQALNVKNTDAILEIGAGSGFMAALLAGKAEFVCSVEIDPEIADFARSNLEKADVANVSVETGDASQAWESGAPYDLIVVSGSLPVLPESLLRGLKEGGRLIAVVGRAPVMRMQLITRGENGTFVTKGILETVIAPLLNVTQPRQFVF